MVDAWCHWRCALCCTIVSFIWRGPHEVPICINCVCVCECMCECVCVCLCVHVSVCVSRLYVGQTMGRPPSNAAGPSLSYKITFLYTVKFKSSQMCLVFMYSLFVFWSAVIGCWSHTQKKNFALQKSQICYTMPYSHRRINVDTCWICRQ